MPLRYGFAQFIWPLACAAVFHSCTDPPGDGKVPASHSGGPSLRTEWQRRLYRNPDSTQIFLAGDIEASDARGDHSRALDGRILLMEAVVARQSPDAAGRIAEIVSEAPIRDRDVLAAWSTYYVAKLHESGRNWPLVDSLLAQLVGMPGHASDTSLQLLARTIAIRQAGRLGHLAHADSIAAAWRPRARESGDLRLTVELLRSLGEAHSAAADPAGALEYFRSAWVEAGKLDDAYLEGRCRLGVAHAQIDLGNNDEAAESCLAAKEKLMEAGDPYGVVSAQKLLGYCYWDVLGPRKVLDQWLPAIQLADSLGIFRESVIVRLNMAKFNVTLDSAGSVEAGVPYAERYDAAHRYIDQADSIAAAHGEPELTAYVVQTRSKILNRQGLFDASTQALMGALSKFRAAGNQYFEVSTMIDIASNEISMRRWHHAEHWLRLALAMAEQSNYNTLRMLALNRLAHTSVKLGRYAEALAYKERWYSLKDSLEGLQVTDRIAQTELRHAFRNQQVVDSLAHVQTLTRERSTAMASVYRLRRRSLVLAAGGLFLALGGSLVFVLDRKRRRERYAKQAAELEAKALRAQMDPHFIGNTLHTANTYLLSNDPKSASELLSLFSKWMRTTLVSSHRDDVSLREDIEAMRTYLTLEQVRTKHKFTFHIEMPDDEELLHVRIPPMLVQPFLENAIRHGVGPLPGRGHITLHIGAVNDQLSIVVEDNGVGRRAVLHRSGGDPEGKLSLGTAITRQRLRLLAKATGRPADARVTDLAQGTRVEIVVPLA